YAPLPEEVGLELKVEIYPRAHDEQGKVTELDVMGAVTQPVGLGPELLGWLNQACKQGPQGFPVSLNYEKGGSDPATLWLGGAVVSLVGDGQQKIFGLHTMGHGNDVKVTAVAMQPSKCSVSITYNCTVANAEDRDRLVMMGQWHSETVSRAFSDGEQRQHANNILAAAFDLIPPSREASEASEKWSSAQRKTIVDNTQAMEELVTQFQDQIAGLRSQNEKLLEAVDQVDSKVLAGAADNDSASGKEHEISELAGKLSAMKEELSAMREQNTQAEALLTQEKDSWERRALAAEQEAPKAAELQAACGERDELRKRAGSVESELANAMRENAALEGRLEEALATVFRLEDLSASQTVEQLERERDEWKSRADAAEAQAAANAGAPSAEHMEEAKREVDMWKDRAAAAEEKVAASIEEMKAMEQKMEEIKHEVETWQNLSAAAEAKALASVEEMKALEDQALQERTDLEASWRTRLLQVEKSLQATEEQLERVEFQLAEHAAEKEIEGAASPEMATMTMTLAASGSAPPACGHDHGGHDHHAPQSEETIKLLEELEARAEMAEEQARDAAQAAQGAAKAALEAEERMEQMEREIETAIEQVVQAESSKDTLQKQVAELKEKLAHAMPTNSVVQNKMAEEAARKVLEKQIVELQGRVDEAEEAALAAEQNCEKLEEGSLELREMVKAVEAQRAELQEEYESLDAQVQEAATQLVDYEEVSAAGMVDG
ncbi:hypothetical protein CYMTET_32915, partial [Cymbomonas tetramitiformis]